MYTVVFIDTEVSVDRDTVVDYGAVVDRNTYIHTKSAKVFEDFLIQNSTGNKRFLCGHNIVHHDTKYIRQQMQAAGITDMIDTLYLSPLLFPNKPYHAQKPHFRAFVQCTRNNVFCCRVLRLLRPLSMEIQPE